MTTNRRMPYKDPEKRKAAQRAAQKRSAAKNPEKERLKDWEKHQKARERRLAQSRKRNRELGHQPRKKGPNSHPVVIVPPGHLAQIYEFNGERHLKFAEGERVRREELEEWAVRLVGNKRILNVAAEKPKTGSRKWRFWNLNDVGYVTFSGRGRTENEIQTVISEFKAFEASMAKPGATSDAPAETFKAARETSDVLLEEGGRRRVIRQEVKRESKNRELKKNEVLAKTGALACEVCGFDFFLAYGECGKGFCEVHHLIPISTQSSRRTPRLNELAVICANCHRMIHRKDRCLEIAELKQIVRMQKQRVLKA